MFLSAKSFADLEGKALLCKWKDSTVVGYIFRDYYEYQKYWILHKNDTYSVKLTGLSKYKLNPEEITLTGIYINRKTLRMFDVLGYDKGQCELTEYKTIRDKIVEHKNKLQEEYNKKLEGNKI
tara:strand:+ start:155 stop:523 length:369 start_codon:yes stop_codon:yes gene_type:complete